MFPRHQRYFLALFLERLITAVGLLPTEEQQSGSASGKTPLLMQKIERLSSWTTVQHSAGQQTSLSVQAKLEGIMPCRSWSGDCTNSTNHSYKQRPLTVPRINTFTSSPSSIRLHITWHTPLPGSHMETAPVCTAGVVVWQKGSRGAPTSVQCQGYFTGIVAMSFADSIWPKLQMNSILPQTDPS